MSDIPASVWTEADASNTTAAPDGAPEGMAPSGVNDVLRAHQGAVKRWYKWTTPATTAGTSTAYTLSYGTAPGALVDGMTHLVQFNAVNGAAPTLNVNSLGATPLHYYSAGAWRAVPAGLWAADTVLRVAYNSSAGTYRVIDLPDRTGEVVAFAGSTAPAGSLLCYGQSLVRTEFAGLFAALSTTYGAADGTHFNLPDLRSYVVAGKSNMGGSDNGALTGGTVLGAALGAQSHSHTGNTQGPGSTTPVRNDATNVNVGTSDHTHGFTTSSESSVQPTSILNYIIRI